MNNTTVPTNQTTTILDSFQFYYTPLLVFTGVFGNTFTIFVLCKTKLRKQSSSYYLIALAGSDTVFLLTLFIVWLKLLSVDLFNKSGFCQTMVYITSVCSFLSVWLVMTFTFERFVAVKYPFLRQTLCTTRRAKITIFSLTSVALVVFSPLLIFSTVANINNTEICSVNLRWKKAANVFNYLDFLVTYLVPVTVIMYLNLSISRTILNLAGVRKILTNQNTRLWGRTKKSVRNRITQNKLTKMLLVVSTVFLCLNFPSYVMRILTYLIELNIIEISDVDLFRTIQHWCLQLFYTNFGINFYLYCISGQNFRKALWALFYVRRLKRSETTALTESRMSSGSSAASRRRRTMTVYVENPEARSSRRQINIPPGNESQQ